MSLRCSISASFSCKPELLTPQRGTRTNCDLALKRKSQIFSIIISLLGHLGFERPNHFLLLISFTRAFFVKPNHIFSRRKPHFLGIIRSLSFPDSSLAFSTSSVASSLLTRQLRMRSLTWQCSSLVSLHPRFVWPPMLDTSSTHIKILTSNHCSSS